MLLVLACAIISRYMLFIRSRMILEKMGSFDPANILVFRRTLCFSVDADNTLGPFVALGFVEEL